MTKEWISKFNEKCAEFLGYVNTTPTDKDFNIYHNEKGMIIDSKIYTSLETMSMKFHSDWNWIHGVLDKIIQIPDGYGYQFKRDIEGCFERKQAVIQRIDNFLGWYMSQQNFNNQLKHD